MTTQLHPPRRPHGVSTMMTAGLLLTAACAPDGVVSLGKVNNTAAGTSSLGRTAVAGQDSLAVEPGTTGGAPPSGRGSVESAAAGRALIPTQIAGTNGMQSGPSGGTLGQPVTGATAVAGAGVGGSQSTRIGGEEANGGAASIPGTRAGASSAVAAAGAQLALGGVTGNAGRAAIAGVSNGGFRPLSAGAPNAGGGVAIGTAGAAGMPSTTTSRLPCTAPTAYPNLFANVLEKSKEETDAKLTRAVDQLFHGRGTDQSIYYELGSDQAYIKDSANNDVRSEGMAFGLLITAMMNMKLEFDRLWNYSAACMRQPSGLFAWMMKSGSCSALSVDPWPVADEYYAMALMIASRRWGDDSGINYRTEALKVLDAMVTQGDFLSEPPIVSYSASANYTAAAYVLPLFYSEWACFDLDHADYWKRATPQAREFFQKATSPTTGLAPDRSSIDGSPTSGSSFGPEAWTVPMNIMMDYSLNGADPWQAGYAQRMANFWIKEGKEGLESYGFSYTLDGKMTNSGHGAGLTGVNAMLAFALTTDGARPFLQALWDAAVPTGTYRYYDGCLYLLSLLHLTGKFDLFY